MSRGFDGLEIDDARTPDRPSGRSGSADNTHTDWSAIVKLSRLHQVEDRADERNRQQQERPDKDHSLPRHGRVQQILSQRTHSRYRDRDKNYSLRDSEIHTLSEVGKFRVIATGDLTQSAYNGDRSRMEHDIENLDGQGLVRQTTVADLQHDPTRMVTLTKEGHKLLSRGKVLRSEQATYHGLKKPKEVFHDADLYRLYHKVSDEIEGRGGRVLRVELDYEMKQDLYASLARASRDKSRDQEAIKEEVARRHQLKVVHGKIPIPDLRIEYVNENDNEIRRRDLELATDHYRPRGLTEKARAGFELYAKREDADRLRRIRDDRELSAAIYQL